ncbi:MAG TPA: YceI family protein [Thermoanaerobaculia bacterium]|jgi:polyisoprenoid-binding protein YceI|nr:YceI family protein [Thermoanaerobaculia bacterium]
MKRFILTLAVAILAAPLFADTYTIDKAHSEATFNVRHFVSRVSGKFDDFAGTINGDFSKPEAASVEFTIKTASVDTGVADRDNHLRSADFFDAAKNPEITFKSTSIKPTGTKNLFNVTGNLTMRGVTKQVTLPVELLGSLTDPWGNTRAGFATHTTLNRKDYGINWNKALDNGGFMLSDDVDITINLETVKKK